MEKLNTITSMEENGTIFHRPNCSKLFSFSLFSDDNPHYFVNVDHIPTCISEEDNLLLLAPFTMDELKVSIFQMHSDESPDPNGLNVSFYKIFWYLCGLKDFCINHYFA